MRSDFHTLYFFDLGDYYNRSAPFNGENDYIWSFY